MAFVDIFTGYDLTGFIVHEHHALHSQLGSAGLRLVHEREW